MLVIPAHPPASDLLLPSLDTASVYVLATLFAEVDVFFYGVEDVVANAAGGGK